jgi:hypothetical protein
MHHAHAHSAAAPNSERQMRCASYEHTKVMYIEPIEQVRRTPWQAATMSSVWIAMGTRAIPAVGGYSHRDRCIVVAISPGSCRVSLPR